jgi:hemerythrin
MNTISTDFKFFIENDINPFILFSSEGSILYLNKSAELLMGIDTQKEIFDLALAHAPQSFGHRVALMELSFSSYEFYGLNTLYNNDQEIGIQLYIRPRPKVAHEETLEGYSHTDINLFLQANIELFNIQYRGKLSLMTDYTMPEIQLHQNSFSLLLRKVFAQFQHASYLEITLTIKIGSKIIIGDKRYPILSLKLVADSREDETDKAIKEIALSNHIDTHFTKESALLEIPAISSL